MEQSLEVEAIRSGPHPRMESDWALTAWRQRLSENLAGCTEGEAPEREES